MASQHKNKNKNKLDQKFQRYDSSRPVSDRVLIVVEGKKTERIYFEELVDELKLKTVKILPSAGSEPVKVINKAKERLSKGGDFDQIYCVFDHDNRKIKVDEALGELKKLSKEYEAKTICAITSIPCFELWYLLHVSGSRKPYTRCGELINELKTKSPFKNYQKNNCDSFFAKIREQRQDAVAHAEFFLREAKKDGDKEFHENPSTRVHCLVKALIDLSENLKVQNTL